MGEHDEFDRLMRETLARAAAHAEPDAQLSERLIANARSGRRVAVPLHHRRSRRVMISLLAAAAVVIAVATAATVTAVNADRGGPASQVPTTQNSAPIGPSPSGSTSPDSTGRPTGSPSTRSTTSGAPRVPVPANFAASDVDAVTDSLIFAIGNARCASGGSSNCPALARTDDGGSTWTRLNLPAGLVDVSDPGCGNNGTSTGPCVRSVAFVTTQIGYVWSVRTMFATTDGGRTWTKQPLGNHFVLALAVHGTAAVRITSVPCSARCGGLAQLSVDGGAWTDVGPIGSATDSADVELFDTESGFVLAVLVTQGTASVYTSTDGLTWTKARANGLCNTYSVIAAHDGSIFSVCGAFEQSRLVRSTDGGATFGSQGAFGVPGVFLQAALDRNTVVALQEPETGPKRLMITRNGGSTWSFPTVPGSGDPFAVDIDSATHWYLYGIEGGATVAYFSNDQGRTWTRLSVR